MQEDSCSLQDTLRASRVQPMRTGLTTGAILLGLYSAADATTCETLLTANLPNVTINSAESIPAGIYQPPGSPVAFPSLPAFCRVTATVTPAPDSSISIEVWLPDKNWNGRYQQVGNHGLGTGIWWSEMVPQLRRGFATGATDNGHPGTPMTAFSSSWAIGHPAKVEDLAFRAVHELVRNAKLLITAFYGKPQNEAYFNGCSDGGREGLREAQQFPSDFNGILIGGVASNPVRAATQQLVASQNFVYGGVTGAAGESALTLALNASTKACDADDGVSDNTINLPKACHWNPYGLVCKPGQSPATCVTSAQAGAIQDSLDPLRNPVTGKWLFSGFAQGSQFDQIQFRYYDGLAPLGLAIYQIAFADLTYDGSKFDLQRDLPRAERELHVLNTTDPDLRPFAAAGGKLIQWHGWSDAAFAPGWEVRYYDDVVGRVGSLRATQDFYRLFMLPGVGHCGHPSDGADGVGPGDDVAPDDIGAENQLPISYDRKHDVVSALLDWTEHSIAPHDVIASKFNNNILADGVQLQRPICAYPAKAVWNGTGSTNLASSFTCK